MLKLNSALIALCHLNLSAPQILFTGFWIRTFGSFSVLGEIKNIVILCDWEVFITTPCPEEVAVKKRELCFLSLGQMKQFKVCICSNIGSS